MSKNKIWLSLGAAVVVIIYLWFGQERLALAPAESRAEDGKLKVSFLDVGQGDAILIKTPGGKKVLIDGGESSERLLSALAEELGWFDKRLDYVILTHPHADHVRGLNGLFDRWQINEAWGTLVEHTASTYQFWLDNLASRQIKTVKVRAPQAIDLDSGVKLTVLSPTADFLQQASLNLNNSSIVLLLSYGQIKFLLMGDAELETEEFLLSQGVDLRAQILKVAHHGSSGATSQGFLTAVSPQLAVISVGRDNDFGHPHERTINRLERSGAKILRTDEAGTIKFLTDGQTLDLVK